MSVEAKVTEASRLLEAAYEESECKWCARHLKELSEITSDLAEVVPFTTETAKRIEASRGKDIAEEGSKIGVLKRVVEDSQKHPDNTKIRENINTQPEHDRNRGIPMAGVGFKQAGIALGSQLGFGVGVGFALNRLDDYWVGERSKAGKATLYYEKLGPMVNTLGGLGLVVLGAMGIGLKGSTLQTMEILGGGAMMQNGVLSLVEGMYQSMGTAGRAPAAKVYYQTAGRAPGSINPRMVDISSF